MKERLKMIPAESDGNKMYRKYKDLVSKRLDRAMMNIEKIHPEFALYIKKTIFDHRVYCPCIVMPWTTKYSKRIGPAELKLSTIKMIGLENHEYGSEQNEDDNKGNENKRHRSNTIVRRKR